MTTPRLLLVMLFPALCWGDSTQLLKNPRFEQGLDGWLFSHAAEYRGKVQKPNIVPAGGTRKLAECSVNVPHASSWHYVHIKQPVRLVNGSKYRVVFEGKYREAPGDLRIATWSPEIQKNNGLNMAFTLNHYWQRFETKFVARNVDDVEVPNFLVGFAAVKGNISVRNFSFEEISDATLKGQVKKIIELEGEANRPQIKTVTVDAQQIIDDFAANINDAKRKYARRNLLLSAPVTGIDKSQRPGTYELLLLGGEIKITVGGNAFTSADYEKLNSAIRNIRREIKDDQKAKKAAWDKLDRAAKLKKEYLYYPTVNCIARIYNYRNRVVEIQQTIDLTVGYASE